MSVVAVETVPYSAEHVARLVADEVGHPATRDFHALWYQSRTTWAMTRYKGIPMLKCPLDLQIYHEILWQLKPTLVIETGTCFGGSALWFADQMEEWGGRVVSIDILDQRTPLPASVAAGNEWEEVEHDRVDFIVGSSTSPDVVAQVQREVDVVGGPVLVSLDSDHTTQHVYDELEAYAPMVTPGSYCVVEDTNVSGRPITASDPGPGDAADRFLAAHPHQWMKNLLCERYLLTMHPGGWLARVA